MEGSKGSGGGGAGAGSEKPSAESNPSLNLPPPTAADVEATDDGGATAAAAAAAEAARRPFTALSQEEADLALARVLQEQERAYMLLRMNGSGGEGSDYGSSDAGSYEYDEEGDDYEEELEHHLRVHHHEHPSGDGDGEGEGEGAEGSDYDEEYEEDEEGEPEVDPAEFENDEAYARALQDAEELEVAARLMALAGLSDWRTVDVEHEEDHVNDPQEAWQEVDPDEYSYEASYIACCELVALGEVVGTENRGLSADALASLPSVTYKMQSVQDGNTEHTVDRCVICRVELEEGESLIALPCKHLYHPECINQWLQINKV
ncbi:Protein binding protein [Zea mays]|uniref:Protein binding protein n=1 Tax=Zea mays TaxID=4577 RepID=A0A1D6ETY6_MAIZE|nr:Protein binding protein [Zea mays]